MTHDFLQNYNFRGITSDLAKLIVNPDIPSNILRDHLTLSTIFGADALFFVDEIK
jgi:hypothetical protein